MVTMRPCALKYLIILFLIKENSALSGCAVVSTVDSSNTDCLQPEYQLAQIKEILQCQQYLNRFSTSCNEIQERGQNSSRTIYRIQPKYALHSFLVKCDMQTRGGGWTYILDRFDGSQDFYLEYDKYKFGIGNLTGEFWLGLEKIHLLTGYEFNELLIQMEDWEKKKVEVHYDIFSVMGEADGYKLRYLTGHSGDVGDSLSELQGMKFTTKDKDQDLWMEGNCANWSKAGWWFNSCKNAQLTGRYLNEHTEDYSGIFWASWHGSQYSLKKANMMVRPWRPRNFNPFHDE